MVGEINKHHHQFMNFHVHIPHLHFHGHHKKDHHHHHHHHHDQDFKDIPKGCVAIKVGHEGEEELQRFVIPVVYVNHPLFMQLLKEAEEEYGFDHEGPITIPCRVDLFLNVQSLIDKEKSDMDHHHHHHVWCF